MTFEEIKAKIEACNLISITEIKEIQYGKSIYLNNGGIVNSFNSGKYTVQGKAQDQVKEILNGTVMVQNRKIFVVYGHDDIARTQLEALLRRWDLEPIILDQVASGGIYRIRAGRPGAHQSGGIWTDPVPEGRRVGLKDKEND